MTLDLPFTPVLAAWNSDPWCAVILAASLYFGIKHRHSFFALPILVCVSLLAQDDYYPLSYFPMYSDPDESENYFYIGTWESDTVDPKPEEITPLPVRKMTGITAPKVKKIQKAWVRGRADEMNDEGILVDGKKVKDTNMPMEEKVIQYLRVLDHLRKHQRSASNPLPEKLALVEVWIEFDQEVGYRETAEVVATQH
ncbi:MAG: hypothetical protein HKN23_20775 [Verrucomicrobiales bacterium]|nr:hypothetical protein [Verrucomicrobiales bacterium]